MIDVAELRMGNLISWNPAIAHPPSTLSPLIVEVAAILPNQVGYVPANIGQRVEPFEDALIQKEPIFKNDTEFEAIKLTPEILAACTHHTPEEHWKEFVREKVFFLHQYQNLHFILTGEELEINNLAALMMADSNAPKL